MGNLRWEDAANWSNPTGAAGYPGWNGTAVTTNDTVTIGTSTSIFMNDNHELAGFTISPSFSGDLFLRGQLTRV
jgi:hypothetical protein